jgi:hypothetical protein
MHLERIEALTGSIDKLTERIEDAMAPFRTAREFLTTIPGVSTLVADTIMPSSPPPGICSPTGSATRTPEQTSSPDATQPKPKTTPSNATKVNDATCQSPVCL